MSEIYMIYLIQGIIFGLIYILYKNSRRKAELLKIQLHQLKLKQQESSVYQGQHTELLALLMRQQPELMLKYDEIWRKKMLRDLDNLQKDIEDVFGK